MLALTNTSPLSYLLCLTRCSRQHSSTPAGNECNGGAGSEDEIEEVAVDVGRSADVVLDHGAHVNVQPQSSQQVRIDICTFV